MDLVLVPRRPPRVALRVVCTVITLTFGWLMVVLRRLLSIPRMSLRVITSLIVVVEPWPWVVSYPRSLSPRLIRLA